ncbi:MAG: hypothetical protein K8I27_10955 [Planctomycetes bacterium]|nr:hypothetical protein [Planctomycetota bacterium]
MTAVGEDAVSITPQLTGIYPADALRAPVNDGDRWVLQWEIGVPLNMYIEVESNLPGLRTQVRSLTVESIDGGAWLAVEDRRTRVLTGIPEATESGDVRIHVVTAFGKGGKERDSSIRLRVEVTPVPEEQHPSRANTGEQTATLLCPVGIGFSHSLFGVAEQQHNWNKMREWAVTVSWTYDGKQLPPGLMYEEKEEGRNPLSVLKLHGVPEEAGRWDVTVTCRALIKYIPEAYETVYRFTLDVTPVPEDELPSYVDAPESAFRVNAVVGKRSATMIPCSLSPPENWNRRRVWQIDGTWQIDEVELPAGMRFETKSLNENQPPRLYLMGVPEQPGEWDIEIKLSLNVTFVSTPFEVTRTIKLTVTD